jgi:hypothetical protein
LKLLLTNRNICTKIILKTKRRVEEVDESSIKKQRCGKIAVCFTRHGFLGIKIGYCEVPQRNKPNF